VHVILYIATVSYLTPSALGDARIPKTVGSLRTEEIRVNHRI
jgi:hypothetical protein